MLLKQDQSVLHLASSAAYSSCHKQCANQVALPLPFGEHSRFSKTKSRIFKLFVGKPSLDLSELLEISVDRGIMSLDWWHLDGSSSVFFFFVQILTWIWVESDEQVRGQRSKSFSPHIRPMIVSRIYEDYFEGISSKAPKTEQFRF